jgi:hypothetical protein
MGASKNSTVHEISIGYTYFMNSNPGLFWLLKVKGHLLLKYFCCRSCITHQWNATSTHDWKFFSRAGLEPRHLRIWPYQKAPQTTWPAGRAIVGMNLEVHTHPPHCLIFPFKETQTHKVSLRLQGCHIHFSSVIDNTEILHKTGIAISVVSIAPWKLFLCCHWHCWNSS